MEEEGVREAFSSLGVELAGPALCECIRICQDRGVDAEALVEAWVAWSVSALGGAAPTVEKLRALEQREFSEDAAIKSDTSAGRTKTGSALTVYGSGHVQPEDNDVLSNYLSTTPKRIKSERTASVAQSSVELTPATYSPKVSHSEKYAARTNAGSVVHAYGEDAALLNIDKPCSTRIADLGIAQVPNEDGATYGNKAMFGFELLHDKASVYDNHIRYLSECIAKKAAITQTSSVRCKSQMEVFVAGRVECDADARLNPKSVVLQGTWEESLSQAVPLDLDQAKQYSLFPGQVVIAKGTNPRGDKFVVQELFTDASLPLADHKAGAGNTFKGTLSIVVASGPYTPTNSMKYEPLKDFVSYVHTHKPHVAIMTGPFLDSEHSMVKDNTMAETYKSFFDKLLDKVAEINTGSPDTKIIIAASHRDAFHTNIYPTPAYRTRRKHQNITFVPDPCTINIGGLVVGITSSDVLMHLGQEEITLGGGDKLGRLAGHLLAQQCYYPLWPPPASQPCDAALWAAHAQLAHTPHLLILPSNLRYFTKEVNGCVVVNPEHLTKGTGGGTFARVQVKIDDDTSAVARLIGCQIVRI